MKDLLSLKKTSEIYDVSTGTLAKWERMGLIKPVMVGSRNKYFSKEAMDRLLDASMTLDEKVLQYYKKELRAEIDRYSEDLRNLKMQGYLLREFEVKRYREILVKIFTSLQPDVKFPDNQYKAMLQYLSGKNVIDLAKESGVTGPAIVYQINSSLKMLDKFCKIVRKSEDISKENKELWQENGQLKKKIKMLEAGYRLAGTGCELSKSINLSSLNIQKENVRLGNIMSSRCLNVLSSLNVTTVGELSKLKKIDLLSRPGAGRRSLEQAEQFLAKYGLEMD